MPANNSPISGIWGSSIVGTYDVSSGTTAVVDYQGAVFGNGGTIAVLLGPGTLDSSGSASVNQFGGNLQLRIGDGLTWSNGGTIDQAGVVQFGTAAADSATFINQPGAIYDLTSGNSQIDANGAGTYAFTNGGLLEMTGGGDNTLQIALSNSGVVSADNGNFYLSGGVTNSGTLQSDGGFLEVQGGVLGGTIQALSNNVGLVGTFTIAGAIGTVTFDDANLGWFGDGEATLAGPGTLVSLGNVHVSQYGSNNQLTLTGGVTWDNGGTIYQDGDIVLGVGTNDSATIVNQGSAVYDLTSGNSQLRVGNSGTYGFVNVGLLEMTGGGGDTLSMPLDNSGLVSAQNGNLYLGGLTTNSGTLQADQGNLGVYGGTLGGLIEDSSTNGTDVFLTGTYTVPADTVDNVVFDNVYFGWGGNGVGVLAGPGTLASNGLINVYQYGGNIQLQLTGGITWTNAGTVNQNGALQFGDAAGDTATLVNQAGATYELSSGNSQIYGNGAGTYYFINAGLLEMVGGGTDTIFVSLTNTGIVSADNGSLVLAGPVTTSGTLEANGGQLYVEGGSLGGQIDVNPQHGGNIFLIDTYTVGAGSTDPVTFAGAYFGDATIATLTGAGTIAASGSVNVYQYGGNVQLVLAGSVTLQNDGVVNQNGALQFGGTTADTATIMNEAGAVYELTSGNAQLTTDGSGTYSFDNLGLLEMTGGGGNTLQAPLTNSGTVSADNGTFFLTSLAANSGTLQTGGGAMQIQGGVLGGAILASNGAINLLGTYAVAPG
ncbi:MAG TPA: hypothetical protein VME47_20535, partial [Acetobacteraceae bacterium]|nr:hypothetical protein [Acetobacteraceae bacterium]